MPVMATSPGAGRRGRDRAPGPHAARRSGARGPNRGTYDGGTYTGRVRSRRLAVLMQRTTAHATSRRDAPRANLRPHLSRRERATHRIVKKLSPGTRPSRARSQERSLTDANRIRRQAAKRSPAEVLATVLDLITEKEPTPSPRKMTADGHGTTRQDASAHCRDAATAYSVSSRHRSTVPIGSEIRALPREAVLARLEQLSQGGACSNAHHELVGSLTTICDSTRVLLSSEE